MNKNKLISYSSDIIINSMAVFWIVLFIIILWYSVSMDAYEGDFALKYANWDQTLLARMDITLSIWLLFQLAGLGAMNLVVYAFRHNQRVTTILIVIFTLAVVIVPWLAGALFPVDLLAGITL